MPTDDEIRARLEERAKARQSPSPRAAAQLEQEPGFEWDRPGSQCRAKGASGYRCQNTAFPGLAVCRFHGAGAPQAKRAARVRLAELVDPAIATLAREMSRADKSADRQRAANSLLDRAGMARVNVVDGATAVDAFYGALREVIDLTDQNEIDPADPAADPKDTP